MPSDARALAVNATCAPPAIVASRCAHLQAPSRGWLLLWGLPGYTERALTDDDPGKMGS
jgi:hypothetical protein